MAWELKKKKKRKKGGREKAEPGNRSLENYSGQFMSLKTLQRYASRGNLWPKTKDHYQKIIEILHKQVNHPFRRQPNTQETLLM